MRTYLKWVILLFLFNSCKEQVKHGKPRVYSIPATKKDSVVLILSNASTINGSAVGFAGSRTLEYDSYEWLVDHGSDSLLTELANHPNPYTKTYAFMAMCKRNHKASREIFEKNIEDTTIISILQGCTGSSCPLNHVWLSKIHPILDSTVSLNFAKKLNLDYPKMRLCIIPD